MTCLRIAHVPCHNIVKAPSKYSIDLNCYRQRCVMIATKA